MLITELIERGARRFPDDVAVLFGEARTAFAEVDRFANSLAHALIGHARAEPAAASGCCSPILSSTCRSTLPVPKRVSPGRPSTRRRRAGPVCVRHDRQAKAPQHTQSSCTPVGLNILLNLVDLRGGDAMLHGASLIHASGTFIVPYWARGGRAAVLPGFQPDTYLRAIADWRPTQLNLVPTMLGMLLVHPAAATADFSLVQTVFCGGSRRRMLGQRPRSWSRAPARWRR